MITMQLTIPTGPDDVDPEDIESAGGPAKYALAQAAEIARTNPELRARSVSYKVDLCDAFTELQWERDWSYNPPHRFITGPDGRSMRNPEYEVL
jgi:hypothetical protein